MGLAADGSGYGAQTVSSYTVTSAGSISFWLRGNLLDAGTQRVLAAGDDFEGLIRGVNDFATNFRAVNTNTFFNSMVVDTLYHIVCTWDRPADWVEVYVDGVLEDDSDDSASTAESGVITMFDRPGTNDPADADLHDVRIYNRVLTLAEIQTIYAARGGDDIVHGMTSRWPMFEGPSGSTISGTGVIKDIGSAKNNFSSASGAPDWVYDAALIPRRR